jgi:hypothetical protein
VLLLPFLGQHRQDFQQRVQPKKQEQKYFCGSVLPNGAAMTGKWVRHDLAEHDRSKLFDALHHVMVAWSRAVLSTLSVVKHAVYGPYDCWLCIFLPAIANPHFHQSRLYKSNVWAFG